MKSGKPQFVGERVRVADAFDLRMGKTPSRKNPAYWCDGGHDWISIADLSSFGKYVGKTKEQINDLAIEESGIKPAPANTVLMSFKLSLGKASITTSPVYTNEAIMAFVDKGDYPVDPSFMYHQCRAKDWTAGTNAAVMGKTLNKKTLGQALVILPGLKEQKAIAEKLDYIEARIVGAKEQVAKLDTLVKSRFVEMFGDPVINTKNWQTRYLKFMGEFKNGVNFKSVDNGYEVKCLGVGDFKDRYSIDDMDLIGAVSLSGEPNANQMLENGDVVFVRSNGNKALVGRCLAVFPEEERLTFSGFCIRFRIRSNDINLDYFLNCMKSDSMRKAMVGRGANIQNLSQTILSRLAIPLPPLALQQEFADFVRQVDKPRFIAQQQIEKLQMLYDSLAQEYFGD